MAIKMSQERYTLSEAAVLIEQYAGEHASTMQDKLSNAAFRGVLPVYKPGERGRHIYYSGTQGNLPLIHTSPSEISGIPGGTSYLITEWRQCVKPFFDEVYWDDLNDWLAANEPRIYWRFPNPETQFTGFAWSQQLPRDSKSTDLEQEDSKLGSDHIAIDSCEVFRNMGNLIADELSITFVGDIGETGMGANNMLEISARGVTKRVALAEFDLVNRNKGELNSQGAILLGMANKQKLIRTVAHAAKMKRLRTVFRKHLGINGDPFMPYRRGAGWTPYFKLNDNRGAADERAKREAKRRTVSHEDYMTERSHPFSSETDLGGNWLKINDPDASS